MLEDLGSGAGVQFPVSSPKALRDLGESRGLFGCCFCQLEDPRDFRQSQDFRNFRPVHQRWTFFFRSVKIVQSSLFYSLTEHKRALQFVSAHFSLPFPRSAASPLDAARLLLHDLPPPPLSPHCKETRSSGLGELSAVFFLIRDSSGTDQLSEEPD
jgi:hypothetical protein